MEYSISHITEIINARAIGPKDSDQKVDILLTDSRSLTFAERTIFFALYSHNNDGRKYIPELYRKGVKAFVVSSLPNEQSAMPEATFLVVEDVLTALQTLAEAHRMKFPDLPVIAITGSKGKTTLKEYLNYTLQGDTCVTRSPRSFNSQIGVPLSVWQLSPDTGLGIFEAGISSMGEMSRLESILHPTIGILTNIGSEHDDGFLSQTDKCREKLQLFTHCPVIISSVDNPIVAEIIKDLAPTHKMLTWSRTGLNATYTINVTTSSANPDTSHIYYSSQDVSGEVAVPFKSDGAVENVINCIITLLHLGYTPEDIPLRIAKISPTGTRLDVTPGYNNCMVINDTYANDLNSLNTALDFMSRRRTPDSSLTVILGDMLHEHHDPSEIYRRATDLLIQKGVTRIIGIGTDVKAHSAALKKLDRPEFYNSTEEFRRNSSISDFSNELILIKTGESNQRTELVDFLDAKHHETVLEVNLDAVVHNFNLFRSQLRPTTGIVAMVKASGYGAGSYELAKTLQSQGAAYLAVAVADEGAELRKAGITMPIMVLNPRVSDYRLLFENNLEPEIYSLEILEQIITEGKKFGITGFPVHIKFDTGMHRLGFLEDDIPALIKSLAFQNVVTPCSMFSHLATADCLDMDDYTLYQLKYFTRCTDKLQNGLPDKKILRHILNSTGITRFPEYQFDMVRLGICLYGYPTLPDHSQGDLHPVSSLYTTIISVKEWEAGTTIGYSRRGVLTRRSRIATIPIGYADGLNRHLGNGNTSVWINGHRCPTVGNICMDACMIDVTDTECRPGDRVEIFGPHISVMELADTLDTIPYEILTSVSGRVKRVYYRE